MFWKNELVKISKWYSEVDPDDFKSEFGMELRQDRVFNWMIDIVNDPKRTDEQLLELKRIVLMYRRNVCLLDYSLIEDSSHYEYIY